jgi:hypothetical protein
LPSVKYFAECFFLSLDKEAFCRVPRKKILGKRKHSAKKLFAEYFIFDTRQRVSLPIFFVDTCWRFDPGGSLDRRVNGRRVSQPRWVGARRSTKGGRNRQRGNLRPSCCPAPRSGALAVGGYKRSRGRERERGPLCVGPFSRATNLLVREPWTSLL